VDFDSLAEGPFLRASLAILALGLIIRTVFFVASLLKARDRWRGGGLFVLTSLGRYLAPLHRAAVRRPIYTAARYLFHFCLLVVPIGLAGHVSLWEESFLGWSWPTLDNVWADRLTLVLLILVAFFLVRRIALAGREPAALPGDLIFLIIVALPFLSGYALAHGTVDAWPFLGENIYTIHLLSGQAMIAATAFLFCRTRFDKIRCVGCGACTEICPTGALVSADEAGFRTFTYAHYRCLACGGCLDVCPEKAAGLRHQLSLTNLFRVFTRERLIRVELATCQRCAAPCAPLPLQTKVGLIIDDDYLGLCPTCRRLAIAVKTGPTPQMTESGHGLIMTTRR